MRLIDADALSSEFRVSDSDIIAKEAINDAPTIDAVHAAGGCYCRECKHFERDGSIQYCIEYGGLVKPDDFCSRGQRKEPDHD